MRIYNFFSFFVFLILHFTLISNQPVGWRIKEEYSMSRAFYDYGETSFSNYIWVKGKGTFYNPKLISFEKITDQSIIVECCILQ